MATFTTHPHGAPSWVDLMSPDVDASKGFYTQLFGWEAADQHDDEGNRIYVEFSKDGRKVAGLGGQMPGGPEGMPPVWNTYVDVEDADRVAKAVEAAGGTVMLPPMDVMQAGRMAVFGDPTGAVFSVWQPGEHLGAELCNEPGSWSWNELLDRDLDTAKAFYSEVFGWEWQVMEMPNGPYNVVQGGENGGLAGAMTMPAEMPDQVPNHWSVYFTVEDTAATCAKVQELGGQVVWGPQETPVGILATVHDPHGGSFALMQHPSQD